MQLTLHSKAVDRRQIARALKEFCHENQVPATAYQAADLALEEHLTNVLNYGIANVASPEVIIRCDLIEGCLQLEVEDNGLAFNPLDAPEVDTNTPLENKPIGGLGLHLMRKFLDALTYRRERERNILRMSKRLAS